MIWYSVLEFGCARVRVATGEHPNLSVVERTVASYLGAFQMKCPILGFHLLIIPHRSLN